MGENHGDLESFEEQVPDGTRDSLVRRLMASGADAPKVLLEAAVATNGRWAAAYSSKLWERDPDADVEDLVRRVIKSHAILARSEGASVAVALTAAEVTSAIGSAGTLTPAAAVSGLVSDLAGLAWIQTRMVLIIAALHGHDPQDPSRYKEVATMMGLFGAPAVKGIKRPIVDGTERVLKRLILRHLRGARLATVKSLFHLVGINFTRTGVLKLIPGVNVPISAVVNGVSTRSLGRRARDYYETLPPAGVTVTADVG